MRTLLLSLILLLVQLACDAQDYFLESRQEGNTSTELSTGINTQINSGYQPGIEQQETVIGNQAQEGDANYMINDETVDFGDIQKIAEATQASIQEESDGNSSTGSTQRDRSTDADCPECTPDPGGDVIDVPFDKRLLVFLFAGAIFIVIKDEKKEKKKE